MDSEPSTIKNRVLKKIFKAPVKTGSQPSLVETTEKANTEKAETSVKTNLEKKSGPTKNENKQKIKNVKEKKEKSLTEAEYEEIFVSVLCKVSLDTEKENKKPREEKEVNEKGDTCKLPAVEQQKLDTGELTVESDSFHTPVFEDLALEKKRKKKKSEKAECELSQMTSACLRISPSKKPSLPQISPWGSHFAKINSQGSSFYKPSDESQSIAGSLFLEENSSEGVSVESEDEVMISSQRSRQKAKLPLKSRNLLSSKDLKERLEKLQDDRNVGLWVYCSNLNCQKQRYLAHITDPLELPDKWYCNMNPDPEHNDCDKREDGPSKEEEEYLIYNLYNAGSLVWAHMEGYPWWPAMVDDCPDYETFYWLEGSLDPAWYHVVFFDEEVTRAWLKRVNIAPYVGHEDDLRFKQTKVAGVNYRSRLAVAKKQAADATLHSTYQRLKAYSFIARYKNPLVVSQTKAKGKNKGKSSTKVETREQQDLSDKNIKKNKKFDKNNFILEATDSVDKKNKKKLTSQANSQYVETEKVTDKKINHLNQNKKNKKRKQEVANTELNKIKKVSNNGSVSTKDNDNRLKKKHVNKKVEPPTAEEYAQYSQYVSDLLKEMFPGEECEYKKNNTENENKGKNKKLLVTENEDNILLKEDNNRKTVNIDTPESPDFDITPIIESEEVGSGRKSVDKNPEENIDSTRIVRTTGQSLQFLVSQDLFESEGDAVVPQNGNLSQPLQ